MDSAGNIGPELDDYAADVRALAHRLHYHGPEYVALVARSTRLEILLMERDTELEGRAFFSEPEGLDDGSWVFAAVRGHGAYWFRVDAYVNPGYVTEKLNVAGGDGETIAELLARIGLALRVAA